MTQPQETRPALPLALSRFAGRWHLARDIFDVDSDWIGKFEGHATFTPRAGGLDYLEEGALSFGGLKAMSAHRRYRWQEGRAGAESGAGVDVFFEDGKFFHRFDPNDPAPKASHFCDPDQYDVAYDFCRWPRWSAAWRVEGPRKDYRMVSVFTPAPLHAPGQHGKTP